MSQSKYPEHLRIEDNESEDDYLIRLFDKKTEYEVDNFTIADLMNSVTGDEYSESKYRKDYASFKRWVSYFEDKKGAVSPEDAKYNESTEIKGNGVQTSDKLIYMAETDGKNPDFLLEAHGYDSSVWELTNAKNSLWNARAKGDGVVTLYSSKITAKPLKQGFDFKKLEKIIANRPSKTYTYTKKPIENGEYLLLPLYDMHFGVATFEYYQDVFNKLMTRLDKNYKEVALIFGQDMFHNDSLFHGRTARGTEIEKADMVQAWHDVTKFFVPIIQKAMDRGTKVTIAYSKGNHSETLEWAYVQYLKGLFPDLEVNDSLKERKVVMLGKNFIGANHGDKKNEKNLPENFATEFPMEWSQATTRTVFVGHRHHEMVIDKGGILVRRMPTKNPIDNYHDDRGYTTAHKRFQIHEFDEESHTGSIYL